MCQGEEKPKCVEWCLNDVLTYQESEEEIEERVEMEELEVGVGSLIDKYGFDKIADTVARMAKKG
jgi:benzoyl-CoA reductase subunit BamC